MLKNILIWFAIGAVLTTVFNSFKFSNNSTEIDYSSFIKNVKQGQVQSVTIIGNEITGVSNGGIKFKTYNPGDFGLIGDLLNNDVNVIAKPISTQSFWQQLIISIAPVLLLIGVILYTMRGASSITGGRNPMSFAKSKAKILSKDNSKITFADVAGVEEAKEEVQELVEFLSSPKKFVDLGAKIPKGVLMIGAPGTGKTLLAKAIAGEADVPFFFISGSDFVEMFVGVGASRVRDMFNQAKSKSPCIIFIDEIDAVGRHRGAGMGGGHDEREQTLNQMLVEMDGFEGTEGVIVIAATNRPDVLDPALLRPGRFDRQVVVNLPDIVGRANILKVHLRKLPVADDVDIKVIARGTPGFSGADLANLANEAALISASNNKKLVSMLELEKAKDKILMGSERKSMVMDEKEKELTAYHESGHAIVGRLMPEHDKVYKVSIIPRGRALGVTMFLPEKDSYSLSKCKLNSQIASLFGGRIAEELIFGSDGVTTGASNDIKRATELAHNMVKSWGLSLKLGPLNYADDESEVFLGKTVTQTKHISENTFKQIDLEVKSIIDKNYKKAYEILTEKIDILHAMAKHLMQLETITDEQIDEIMEGKEPTIKEDKQSSTKKSKDVGRGKKPNSEDDNLKGTESSYTRNKKDAE